MCLRLKPFEFCYLGFYGFSEEDKKQMEELTSENGESLVLLLDAFFSFFFSKPIRTA